MKKTEGGTNTLFSFGISHFCEKARWALDLSGTVYAERAMLPGRNIRLAKRHGLTERTLPILQGSDGFTIQGSSSIVDWAAAKSDHSLLRGDREIETQIDHVFGGPLAFFYYSEVIATDHRKLRSVFRHRLDTVSAIALYATWPIIRQAMIKGMDLGPKQARKSRDDIRKGLDWLDDILADGRPFLAGEEPGREDLTAASLLALLVFPESHPMYGAFERPKSLAAFSDENRERPSLSLPVRMYADYRK